MNFTEEQLAFQDSVRRMVARHVAPIAAEIDESDRFPTELVKLYGEMGLMQLWIPEQYGGPGGNLTMMCIAREEISRASPACGSIAGLNTMFIMPLLHFGTEEQRQRFLPPVAKGGVVTAIAISEPQAGSDVGAMKTRAVRDGDSYVLNGRKQWCSYGVEADYIVVMARTSGESGAEGISAFVIEPKKMAGVTFGRHERKMGWRGAPNTPIFLDNVRVPAENLIGEEGKGFRYILSGMNAERILIASECVGDAKWFIKKASDYAKERTVFGRPIGQNQGIQFPIAKSYANMRAAELMVKEATRLYEAGKDCGAEANMAKMLAADASFEAANACIQTHGGFGFAEEYDVERKFRETRLYSVAPISTNLILSHLSEHVLGMPRSY